MSNKKIIRVITEAITASGIKKKVIAERSGLTDRQFSDILHGRRKISADEVMPICKAINLSPNELFGYETA